MGREDNVAIFRDTEKLCKNSKQIQDSVRQSIAGQKLILENNELMVSSKKRYEKPASVVVSGKRSFEAAADYKGQKVCVHNFASATNPGGGVVNGASAQEECLCRCSGLYFCLNIDEIWDGFYMPHRKERNPLHNDDIIYTPELTVFKSDTAYPKLMSEEAWYNVNVITCAAPNLRQRPSNAYNPGDGDVTIGITEEELLFLHEKRLARILDVALSEGNEVVILGAFGCGAFANEPEIVAQAAKNVVDKYRYAFKTIEFAVYCNPWDKKNFEVFKRVIGGVIYTVNR